MTFKTQKRLAAQILKIGESRVWIDPEGEDVESAMTRGDIRKLIGLGIIQAKPKKGNSRGRIRKAHSQKKKGRRRGMGRRKGAKGARLSKKQAWTLRMRSQRAFLRKLRDSGKLKPHVYRRTYKLAKAGNFKTLAHLKLHLKENK